MKRERELKVREAIVAALPGRSEYHRVIGGLGLRPGDVAKIEHGGATCDAPYQCIESDFIRLDVSACAHIVYYATKPGRAAKPRKGEA